MQSYDTYKNSGPVDDLPGYECESCVQMVCELQLCSHCHAQVCVACGTCINCTMELLRQGRREEIAA